MRFKKQRFIARIHSGRTHCWWVRFHLGAAQSKTRGLKHHKVFTDGVYGSKTKAYKAAVAHRDKCLIEHPEWAKTTQPTKKRYFTKPRANRRKSTGIAGVCRIDRPDRSPVYAVGWRQTNKQTGEREGRSRQFTFKDGDEESRLNAYLKALLVRIHALKTHYIGPVKDA